MNRAKALRHTILRALQAELAGTPEEIAQKPLLHSLDITENDGIYHLRWTRDGEKCSYEVPRDQLALYSRRTKYPDRQIAVEQAHKNNGPVLSEIIRRILDDPDYSYPEREIPAEASSSVPPIGIWPFILTPLAFLDGIQLLPAVPVLFIISLILAERLSRPAFGVTAFMAALLPVLNLPFTGLAAGAALLIAALLKIDEKLRMILTVAGIVALVTSGLAIPGMGTTAPEVVLAQIIVVLVCVGLVLFGWLAGQIEYTMPYVIPCFAAGLALDGHVWSAAAITGAATLLTIQRFVFPNAKRISSSFFKRTHILFDKHLGNLAFVSGVLATSLLLLIRYQLIASADPLVFSHTGTQLIVYAAFAGCGAIMYRLLRPHALTWHDPLVGILLLFAACIVVPDRAVMNIGMDSLLLFGFLSMFFVVQRWNQREHWAWLVPLALLSSLVVLFSQNAVFFGIAAFLFILSRRRFSQAALFALFCAAASGGIYLVGSAMNDGTVFRHLLETPSISDLNTDRILQLRLPLFAVGIMVIPGLYYWIHGRKVGRTDIPSLNMETVFLSVLLPVSLFGFLCVEGWTGSFWECFGLIVLIIMRILMWNDSISQIERSIRRSSVWLSIILFCGIAVFSALDNPDMYSGTDRQIRESAGQVETPTH